jgi:hypothetical protein
VPIVGELTLPFRLTATLTSISPDALSARAGAGYEGMVVSLGVISGSPMSGSVYFFAAPEPQTPCRPWSRGPLCDRALDWAQFSDDQDPAPRWGDAQDLRVQITRCAPDPAGKTEREHERVGRRCVTALFAAEPGLPRRVENKLFEKLRVGFSIEALNSRDSGRSDRAVPSNVYCDVPRRRR